MTVDVWITVMRELLNLDPEVVMPHRHRHVRHAQAAPRAVAVADRDRSVRSARRGRDMTAIPRTTPTGAAATGNADRDNWRTPPHVVSALADAAGYEIVLDLCASLDDAVCVDFFGPGSFRADLAQITASDFDAIPGGAAWCNPPYSQILRLVPAILRVASIMPVLALVPCAPETRWHRALAARTSRILCPTRRIAYIAPDGVTDSGSPPGTTWCLVIGDRPATPELHYIDCSPEGVLL